MVVLLSSTPVVAESDSGMQQLRLALDVAVGQPTATALNRCRAIALGVKPCGGPREYLIYSIEVTEPRTLHDLVEEYNRCDHDRNQRLGLMSDCEYVAEPTLALNNGMCEASPPRKN